MRNNKLPGVIAIWLAACGNPSSLIAEPQDPAQKLLQTVDHALTMPVARAAHSAVALDTGHVLLIGGCVRDSCELGPDSGTVDVFDPRTNRFKRFGNLRVPRVSTTAAVLPNNTVFIAGGWAGSTVTDSTEVYDVRAGRSRAGPDLSTARADMAVVTLPDGRVLLLGGYDGQKAVSTIDVFDPSTGVMQRAGTLVFARAGAGAAFLPDGRVLVVGGGINGQHGLRATATAEIVDPVSGRSTLTGDLADARYKHAVVALKSGGVLVIGGSDERDSRGKLDTIEAYDRAAGRFKPAGRLLMKRYKIGGSVVVLPDGRLLVGGGAPRAELYDPSTTQTEYIGPDLGGALNFSTVTLLSGGGVLIAGGYYEDGIRMNRRSWRLQ